MLLRKQTVWLLTMLSLVAVLSVYYITSPQEATVNQSEQKEQSKSNTNTTKKTSNANKTTVVTNEASDSVFEAMRIDLNDERSREKEELTNKVASSDLTEEERVAAHEEIEALSELSTKEDMLETMIISELGYKDALVRAENDKIQITVKADKPNAESANKIIKMVTKELGKSGAVAVEFQPGK